MQSWFVLREFLDSLDSETEFGSLDLLSKRLLEWIAVRSRDNAPLYIQEIVMKSQVASPATIHKVLSNLERMDLIVMTIDVEDTRRRIVGITVRAHKLFTQLSRAVDPCGVPTAHKVLSDFGHVNVVHLSKAALSH
jgi:DNA-binding MarR family transcriptional regulator